MLTLKTPLAEKSLLCWEIASLLENHFFAGKSLLCWKIASLLDKLGIYKKK